MPCRPISRQPCNQRLHDFYKADFLQLRPVPLERVDVTDFGSLLTSLAKQRETSYKQDALLFPKRLLKSCKVLVSIRSQSAKTVLHLGQLEFHPELRAPRLKLSVLKPLKLIQVELNNHASSDLHQI